MPRFKLDFETAELLLRDRFTIARGSKSSVKNVFVCLEADGIEGFGEAGPNTRYNEDAESVILFLESLPDDFFDDVNSPSELVEQIDQNPLPASVRSAQSAKSAIEMAWLDWWSKKQGTPLWKLWEAPTETGPVTSFTIGLDELDAMQRKTEAAEEYPMLKVKLGTERDREIITAIREITDKPVRVDVNEGWKTVKQAKAAIGFLADQNIELIEQPMPADQLEDMISLKKYSPIPLCADESFEGDEDLETIAQAFDAINIKLMKTGSMIKARRIIDQARKAGLEVMIGCMIESSLANTAGAILSLWADYADLDGHLLIENDPFEGLYLDEGKRIIVPDAPGLGVVKNV